MSGRPAGDAGSGAEPVRVDLEGAADELAAVASQGQADVESPTGGRGEPAGSDVEGAGPEDRAGRPATVPPDDVAPGPDVETGGDEAGAPVA